MKSFEKKRKIIISLFIALLFLGVLLFLVFRPSSVMETLKRESAKLFVYEYIPNQKVDMESRMAVHSKDSLYLDFRKRFRFHYQTIAVCDFPDSSKLLIITEPPPYFESDSLHSVFAKFTYSVETKYHKIGYDGRITDIVVCLGNATQENTANLIANLSEHLYLSNYKPQVTFLQEDQKRIYFSKSNLDYQITLYEFNDWFVEQGETFIRLSDTTHAWTISELLSQRLHGVYFSSLPGFVAWVVPKKSDIQGFATSIRQFTLDADLILGAISDSSTLVIIGREREAPLHELPPLNVETILLLASITEKELSQSLDVNDFLAGKMKNGYDWCPTYLSRELENTEFGHLLTITDVLLKDWSERGTIKEAHYRYPKPGYYPFDKPLFRKLGLNELVYNWNTENVMYAIDQDEMTIYTLNRTGSLPVSYFHSQERSTSVGSRYENQAYHYFATLGNTDLARVVQYTALYQLFIDNEITYSGDVYSSFPKNKPYLLLNPTKAVIHRLRELSNADISYLGDTLSKIKFEEYQKKDIHKQMSQYEGEYRFQYTDEQRETIYKDIVLNTKQEFEREFLRIRTMLESLSGEETEKMARYLAYPRGTRIRDRESYNRMLKAKQLNYLLNLIGKNHLDLIGVDMNGIKNYFVNSLSTSSGRYLKTPSVIITFNDFLTTGGHNLSSKISRVNSMTHYKKTNTATPKDYSQERKEHSENERGKLPEKPVETTPPISAKTPIGTSSPASKSSTNKTTSSTKSGTTPKPAIRSREEVIPATSRSQRGL